MAIGMALLLIAAVLFCFTQFIDLMRRPDSEFPGRFDKPIWAVAILLANVLGAAAYWMSKASEPESPESTERLEAELAAAMKRRDERKEKGPEIA